MIKISEILGYQPIDIHSHLDHGVEGDRRQRVGNSAWQVHKCELDFIKEGYDIVGISCGAFSTFSSLSEVHAYEENEYLYELAQKTDWIYQWIAIDPKQDELFEQYKIMMASPKTLGIKLHTWHNYDIIEYADKIFSFANKLGATVLMHNVCIPDMVNFANKYPDMKLIIAHIAGEEWIDAINNAKHKNIYVDTSGGMSALNNVIERAVERVGADNILFGTDTYSTGFQVGRIAWARISDADKKKILRDNAKRLFPRAFGEI